MFGQQRHIIKKVDDAAILYEGTSAKKKYIRFLLASSFVTPSTLHNKAHVLP
jgi:hypothetical protein